MTALLVYVYVLIGAGAVLETLDSTTPPAKSTLVLTALFWPMLIGAFLVERTTR